MSVRWVISVFDRTTDALVDEYVLEHVHLEELRPLVGEPKDSPLHASYPLGAAAKAYFEKHYGLRFERDRYDYFLECERT